MSPYLNEGSKSFSTGPRVHQTHPVQTLPCRQTRLKTGPIEIIIEKVIFPKNSCIHLHIGVELSEHGIQEMTVGLHQDRNEHFVLQIVMPSVQSVWPTLQLIIGYIRMG